MRIDPWINAKCVIYAACANDEAAGSEEEDLWVQLHQAQHICTKIAYSYTEDEWIAYTRLVTLYPLIGKVIDAIGGDQRRFSNLAKLVSAYISFGVDYLVVVTRWKHQLQMHMRTTPQHWRITGAVWSYLASNSVTITTPHWSLTTQLADGPILSVRSSWHPSVFKVCSSTTLSK